MYHYIIKETVGQLVLASSKYDLNNKGYSTMKDAINAGIEFKEENNFKTDCSIYVEKVNEGLN